MVYVIEQAIAYDVKSMTMNTIVNVIIQQYSKTLYFDVNLGYLKLQDCYLRYG